MAPDLLDGDPDLPTLINRLMSANAWDQAEVAARLTSILGRRVSQGTVSRWRQAKREPRRDYRSALAQLAGITLAQLGTVLGNTDFQDEVPRSVLERENAEMRARLERYEREMATLPPPPRPKRPRGAA